MESKGVNYEDFVHSADQLSAYMLSVDTFVISLKNGKVVRFEPKDASSFLAWLKKNDVRDVNESYN